uniref:Uncharacterized protein n=1 Tax=Timema tahoe TaxID=61484 RepID=A0A7R9FFM5_9NEOP|nr:unnamed protein product [Timema tahoe]
MSQCGRGPPRFICGALKFGLHNKNSVRVRTVTAFSSYSLHLSTSSWGEPKKSHKHQLSCSLSMGKRRHDLVGRSCGWMRRPSDITQHEIGTLLSVDTPVHDPVLRLI